MSKTLTHSSSVFVTFLFLCALLLTACQQRDPAATIQAYLEARTNANAEQLRSLSCAEWEEQAALEAASFRSVEARLDGVVCRVIREEAPYTIVGCDGSIMATYNGEERALRISNFRLIQEDGEWKMCGEAE